MACTRNFCCEGVHKAWDSDGSKAVRKFVGDHSPIKSETWQHRMAIRESVHAKYMRPSVCQCWIQSQFLTSMRGLESFGIDSPKRWYDLQSITII